MGPRRRSYRSRRPCLQCHRMDPDDPGRRRWRLLALQGAPLGHPQPALEHPHGPLRARPSAWVEARPHEPRPAGHAEPIGEFAPASPSTPLARPTAWTGASRPGSLASGCFWADGPQGTFSVLPLKGATYGKREGPLRRPPLLLRSAASAARATPPRAVSSAATGSSTATRSCFHEKLGRNDPCPCGSGRRFQEVLHA